MISPVCVAIDISASENAVCLFNLAGGWVDYALVILPYQDNHHIRIH